MITFRVFVTSYDTKQFCYLEYGHIEQVVEINPTQLGGDGFRVAIREFKTGVVVPVFAVHPHVAASIIKDCKRKFERMSK